MHRVGVRRGAGRSPSLAAGARRARNSYMAYGIICASPVRRWGPLSLSAVIALRASYGVCCGRVLLAKLQQFTP
jgi:hypothetical protein